MSRELLQLARDAAWAGAAVIERNARHVTGRRVEFRDKTSPIDLVTDVDREAEHAVLAVLRRSGIAIVAEESGGESSDPVWYVDPLDGTTNFAHGHPFCAVSVGLVRNGAPELGVVHAPLLGTLWSGGVGLGATRKDLFRGLEHELRVSETSTLGSALATTGFPYDRRTTSDDNVDAFRALLKQTHGVLRCGSAAIDLALVADGTYDAYWERKLNAWDIAAGAALVLAAGGRVSSPWGGPLAVARGAIAATNGVLHDELLRAISAHQPPGP